MMGSRMQTTAMFQYFCPDGWVPEDHLLRAVDEHIDLRPIREQLRPIYSDIGRPSIDPEVLLRILLIGYLYGITSERRLLDEIGLNLAYRWFTGLGFDQSIPDHSTFSKNRHGRFRDSSVFRDLFETIVQRCVNVGLVQGERLSVDGTAISADASSKSRVSREQLPEAAKVSRTLREYLTEVEAANPRHRRKIKVRLQKATRSHRPIPMRHGQRRAASLRSLATMTTISSTTIATSSLTLKRRRRVFRKKSLQHAR